MFKFHEFLYMSIMAVARSSPEDSAICYVLPVLCMTSFLHNGAYTVAWRQWS